MAIINTDEIVAMKIRDCVFQFLNIQHNPTTRKREYVYSRKCVVHFIKKYTKLSLSKIGQYVNLDHAGVLHNIKTLNNLIETEAKVKNDIRELNTIIDKLVNDFNSTDYLIATHKLRWYNGILQQEFIDTSKNFIYVDVPNITDNV